MAVQGFDYTSVSPATIKGDGASFVVRYLGTSPKCITPAERYALHARGVAVGVVYETTGVTFQGGRGAGQTDGSRARAAAQSLGVPAGAPIWFAIDTDTSDYALVNEYLAGAASTCAPYAARLYGGVRVIDHAPGSGHWQTYAWSAGKISAKASLYQYSNGATLDRDRLLGGGLAARNGWLTFSTSTPAPTPAPAPVPAPVPPKGPTVTPVQRAQRESLHPTRSYFDQCLVFVRTCFGLAADGHEPTAYSAWLEAGGASGPNTHTKRAAPPNVPVFFKGSGPAGHIALSAGHGMVWSSDIARRGKVDLTSDRHIEAAWGMRYLGWAEMLEGKRIIPHV